MYKKVISIFLGAFLSCTLVSSTYAADTPLLGYKWGNSVIWYQNNGTNTAYKSIWTTGASEWNSATVATLGTDTYSPLTAGNKSVSNVTWDGIMEPVVSNGLFQSAKVWVNTYYTEQSHYLSEPNAIQSIATHELGHALGLAHAPSNTFSVMVPATFFSDGSFARIQYFPGLGDIASVDSLYSNSFAKPDEGDQVNRKNVVDIEISWSKWYLNLEHLAEDADLVVKAQVRSKDGTIITGENYHDFRQKSEINIKEILKGDPELINKDIILYQMGGENKDVLVRYHGTTVLNQNDNVILYLKKIGENEYIPINEDVSIFKLNSANQLVNLQSNEVFTESKLIEESRLK